MSIRTILGMWLAALSSIAASLNAADWYVDAANCPGGTGTRSDPFCTIEHAVVAAAGGDTVFIAPAVYFESLQLSKDLVLRRLGPGTVEINGSRFQRPLSIASGVQVFLRGLTLADGRADNGAGIRNEGDLSMHRCVVERCVAAKIGAGIHNLGRLEMFGSELRNNGVQDEVLAIGGGLSNSGHVILRHCSLHGNECGARNELERNGQAFGGGIANFGHAELLNCTLSDNSAVCEISVDNLRADAYSSGGGIHNGGSLILEHCTIAFNSAIARSRGSAEAYGGGVRDLRQATLGSSIVTHNQVVARGSDTFPYVRIEEGPDCWGTLRSEDYNLVLDCSDFSFSGPGSHNLCGFAPLLDPLSLDGGPVVTHALKDGSPALDSAHPDPLQAPAWDARGYPRARVDSAVGTADRGAWEGGGASTFRLQTIPESVAIQGSALQLSTGRGPAFELSWTALVSINGSPLFLRLFPRILGPSGGWSFSTQVPVDPALSGASLGLQTLALTPENQLVSSNVHTFQIQ